MSRRPVTSTGASSPTLGTVNPAQLTKLEQYYIDARERYQGGVELVSGLIKSLVIVNGGAAVAIVALATKDGGSALHIPVEAQAATLALGWFVGGLCAAIAAGVLSGVSQYFIAEYDQVAAAKLHAEITNGPSVVQTEWRRLTANWTLVAVALAAVVSLACFALGSGAGLKSALQDRKPALPDQVSRELTPEQGKQITPQPGTQSERQTGGTATKAEGA